MSGEAQIDYYQNLFSLKEKICPTNKFDFVNFFYLKNSYWAKIANISAFVQRTISFTYLTRKSLHNFQAIQLFCIFSVLRKTDVNTNICRPDFFTDNTGVHWDSVSIQKVHMKF